MPHEGFRLRSLRGLGSIVPEGRGSRVGIAKLDTPTRLGTSST